LRRRLDIAIAEAREGATKVELTASRAELDRLASTLSEADSRALRERLAAFQLRVAEDFASAFDRLQRGLAPRAFTVRDLSPELSRRFVGASGRLLMRIHPRGDPWDRDGAERFVADLRSVDPDVTGSPVIRYEATRRMEAAYYQGTIYALVLVTLIGGATLRKVRDTALALVPLMLGLTWTLGLMAIGDLHFNLANVFGLPIMIGAAAEYGFNIVLRHREMAGSHEPLAMRSTLMAVLFNGLTTIAGFGSLLVAKHGGIFSLGLLLTVGATASLVASLVVLPSLLSLLPGAVTRRVAAGDGEQGRKASVHGVRPDGGGE
jgi:hypothetical protein